MKFEPKMSGTKVTDFDIKPLFKDCIFSLEDVQNNVFRQETMDWILDYLRFTKGTGGWYAAIDWDTNLKLAILEHYPNYEEEMINYFGKNWLKQYIRFNH